MSSIVRSLGLRLTRVRGVLGARRAANDDDVLAFEKPWPFMLRQHTAPLAKHKENATDAGTRLTAWTRPTASSPLRHGSKAREDQL